jgi:hypothetical protein
VPNYRACFVNGKGGIDSFRAFTCNTDGDAVVWAKHLLDGLPIELWNGDRLVERVGFRNKPAARTFEIRAGRMVPKRGRCCRRFFAYRDLTDIGARPQSMATCHSHFDRGRRGSRFCIVRAHCNAPGGRTCAAGTHADPQRRSKARQAIARSMTVQENARSERRAR